MYFEVCSPMAQVPVCAFLFGLKYGYVSNDPAYNNSKYPVTARLASLVVAIEQEKRSHNQPHPLPSHLTYVYLQGLKSNVSYLSLSGFVVPRRRPLLV